MGVEHLWFSGRPCGEVGGAGGGAEGGDSLASTVTRMADQRLYKLVKWCKSLPLFKNIMVKTFPSLMF